MGTYLEGIKMRGRSGRNILLVEMASTKIQLLTFRKKVREYVLRFYRFNKSMETTLNDRVIRREEG